MKHTQLEVDVNANGAIQVKRVGGLAVAEIWLRGDRERELKLAQLMAAAPDLLAIVKEYLRSAERPGGIADLADIDAKARAVVAKATAQS